MLHQFTGCPLVTASDLTQMMNKTFADTATSFDAIGPSMDALRQQAESQSPQPLLLSLDQVKNMSPESIQEALHELQVHKIKLEMQNENLRQTQIQLSASRARYFELYDLAPVGYLTLSNHGLIIQANLMLAKLLSTSRSALFRSPITQFILDTDQHIYYRLIRQLQTTHYHQSCELRMLKNDGTQFWGSLNATFLQEADDSQTIHLVLSDITEQKQIEIELRNRKKRFQLLFDRASDGIIIMSPEGRIIKVNEAFARLHGYTPQEMHLMSVQDFDTPDSARLAGERIARVLAGEAVTFEVEHRHKDGHTLSLEVSSSLIISNGEPLIQAFIRDISERKLLQDELVKFGVHQKCEALKLEDAMTRLRSLATDSEEALEQEKKFIARELHDELGQLLTALRIEIGLFKMDFSEQVPELNESSEKMLAILDRAVISMRGVVSDLRPIALDIGLVAALEWLHKDFTKMFRIPCVLTCNANIPPLSESKTTVIYRITQELLTNVAKHARASLVHINLYADGDCLQLLVQDNGVGFDINTERDHLCFGLLGLHERALSLHGEVLIDSAPGKGCCVTIDIPLNARGGGKK